MSLKTFVLGSILITPCLFGCAHKQSAAPAQPAAVEKAPAPAAAPTPTPDPAPAPAPETPPPAPPAPPPECTAATDCASKGTPAKGMQWACTDSKCAEEKKPAAGKKKSKKS